MNNPGKASLPVIKRLPKYYRYLRTLKNDGITSISSRELAAQMGTTASQVRQDFNCIGDVNGRQGIGYRWRTCAPSWNICCLATAKSCLPSWSAAAGWVMQSAVSSAATPTATS